MECQPKPGVVMRHPRSRSNGSVVLLCSGIFEMPAVESESWEWRDIVYWDFCNERVTKQPGEGHAALVAAKPKAEGEIKAIVDINAGPTPFFREVWRAEG